MMKTKSRGRFALGSKQQYRQVTPLALEALESKHMLAGDGTLAAAVSDLEVQELVFMREEEKLARDVYAELAERFDSQVFANIVESEVRHMASVGNLIERYKIDDPVQSDARGSFSNETFATLYADLVESGSQNLAAAYQVGVFIEETDIADITDALTVVERNDIRRVFENLRAGSQNHLAAFTGRLNDLADLNQDSLVNAQDIDTLYAALGSGSDAAIFDLNADQQVDQADVEVLVVDAMGSSFGDADLDGAVTFADFLVVAENFGSQDAGWSDGDFDGDGTVGFADFLMVSKNFDS